MGVAGANYGYALMWVLVLAIFMRFVLVSLIARYHLCNQHGESVIDGLFRLHRAWAPGLAVTVVVMGSRLRRLHDGGRRRGVRQPVPRRSALALGGGVQRRWRSPSCSVRPTDRSSSIFKLFLGLLSVSFVGSALFVGAIRWRSLQGLFRLEMPDATGRFNPLLVGGAMIGAVGGSLMNLSLSLLPRRQGLARTAVSPRPDLRLRAGDAGDAGAEPGRVDPGRGAALPGSPDSRARRPAGARQQRRSANGDASSSISASLPRSSPRSSAMPLASARSARTPC